VATPRSASNTPQAEAFPHGHESTPGWQVTVQIFVPLWSRAQIWPGTARQSASVSHELQKLRRTHAESRPPSAALISVQKKPLGQVLSSSQALLQYASASPGPAPRHQKSSAHSSPFGQRE
jgi:hypothetical protein